MPTPKLVQPSLSPRDLQPILRTLGRINAAAAGALPGEPEDRQPVHTVYGGAHLFRRDTARRLGDLALAALDEYAPDAAVLHEALQFDAPAAHPHAFAGTVRASVVTKRSSVRRLRACNSLDSGLMRMPMNGGSVRPAAPAATSSAAETAWPSSSASTRLP